MGKGGSGKSHREGLTLLEVLAMSPDERLAPGSRSSAGPAGRPAPFCHTHNGQSNINHKTMTHRCRQCEGKPMFSLKTGTVMEGSKLPYRPWAIATSLFTTNIKGVSSLKLHRDLGISQKAAWFMLHRLRKAYEIEVGPFNGPIEVDEHYSGGKYRNMSVSKRRELSGCGPVGKTAVIGIKDRDTNHVSARVVDSTDKDTLQYLV